MNQYFREVTADSIVYDAVLDRGVPTVPRSIDKHARKIAKQLGLEIDHISGDFDKTEYHLKGEVTEEQAEEIMEKELG